MNHITIFLILLFFSISLLFLVLLYFNTHTKTTHLVSTWDNPVHFKSQFRQIPDNLLEQKVSKPLGLLNPNCTFCFINSVLHCLAALYDHVELESPVVQKICREAQTEIKFSSKTTQIYNCGFQWDKLPFDAENKYKRVLPALRDILKRINGKTKSDCDADGSVSPVMFRGVLGDLKPSYARAEQDDPLELLKDILRSFSCICDEPFWDKIFGLDPRDIESSNFFLTFKQTPQMMALKLYPSEAELNALPEFVTIEECPLKKVVGNLPKILITVASFAFWSGKPRTKLLVPLEIKVGDSSFSLRTFICQTYGNVNSGHVTSYVKRNDGHWYYCNDLSTKAVVLVPDISHAIRNLQMLPYIMFYLKKEQN